MNSHRSRKRRRDESSSPDPDNNSVSGSGIAKILRKIDRRLNLLERENKKYRPRSPSFSSEDYSSESSRSDSESAEAQKVHTVRRNENSGDSARDANHSQEHEVVTQIPLEKDILSILGTEEKEEKSFSDPIQPELASRWIKILHSGLSDETKIELIKKYYPPENCTEVNPPRINLEVKKAVPENTIRRDARLSQLQGQIGAATSAVAWLITDMLKEGEGVNMKYIECLNDIGRLLSDVHHSESVSRRELIALNINKDLKDTLTDTPITEWLFGRDLDNTIKAAKDLEKSSEQLKPQKRTAENQSSSSKQGNFKRPPSAKKGTFQSGRVSRVPCNNKGRKQHIQRYLPYQSRKQSRHQPQGENRRYRY